MKEKKERNERKQMTISLMVVFIVIMLYIAIPPVVARIVCYNTNLEIMQDEISSYSPDTYEYLLGAVNDIFKEEEKVVDIKEKPENIVIESVRKRGNEFVWTLRLDEENTSKYYPIPKITVELSEDFKILSTTSDYSSKEKFSQEVRYNIMEETSDVVIAVIGIQGLIIVGIVFAYKIFRKKVKA